MLSVLGIETRTVISLCFLLAFPTGLLQGQTFSSPQDNQLALKDLIEDQIDRNNSDSTYEIIHLLIRGHCGQQDRECLYQHYRFASNRLEASYDLFTAIRMCENALALAVVMEDPRRMAAVHNDLNRFHDAMGNDRLAATHLEEALGLYREIGDNRMARKLALFKAEKSVEELGAEAVLPLLDSILAEAMDAGDSISTWLAHRRILPYRIGVGQYEEAIPHIEALERAVETDSMPRYLHTFRLTAADARGDIERSRGNYAQAAAYFQEALEASVEGELRWLEISVLRSMADLEILRNDLPKANSYLDLAESKASELELHNLLSYIYAQKVQIAEIENRFEDALAYTRLQYTHEKEYENRGAGFSLQNYYLQVEKEQLETERQNQELELQLQKSRTRAFAIITFLAFLFVGGLALAFANLRRKRRALVQQNTLIQEQTEQLKTLDKAKTRFFANVSHELRTPLTLLLGPIHSLLRGSQLSPKQQQLLEMASRNGRQLEQLVGEILDLGKLEMDKMTLKEKPTHIAKFFRYYFAQFDSLTHRKGIQYSFSTSVDDELVALIDQTKCRQIIYNLLSNAFKFTPSEGRIEARLSVVDEQLELTVADSGKGIHPDDIPHLFDRYFQTNQPDKPAEGGSGIGLALCQEYAHLFGGKIAVQSRLGEGAEFKISFPLKRASAEERAGLQADTVEAEYSPVPTLVTEETEERIAASVDSTKPRLLVVEDNEELQEFLRLILSDYYTVEIAGNGQQALEQLAEMSDCELILSDLMMPIMDGYQLLTRLKEQDATRHLPVIMLTARADARDRLKALRIGVDDYLVKPFEEEELLARIDNLLQNQKIRQEEVQAVKQTDNEAKAEPSLSTADQEWLTNFEAFVQQHLADDTMNVPVLAQEFAMSESTLLRQLKRLTGLSPLKYLQEMRLDKARQLLENNSDKSIAQIASTVGYRDARSFTRIFKKRYGKSPSMFVNG